MKRRNGLFLLAGLVTVALQGTPASADPKIEPSRGGHVFFEGQIREGALALTADRPMTLSQALVAEGGMGASADQRHVYILRHESDGSIRRIEVNVLDIIEEGHYSRDPVLMAGDMIVVPQKPQQSFVPDQ